MTDTYLWDTYVGTSGQGTFRTRTAQFGDGYAQDVADGINNEVQQWTHSASDLDSDTLDEIMEFLRAHKGYMRFLWTPPNGEEGYYICRQYTMNPGEGELRSFTAVFEQRSAP